MSRGRSSVQSSDELDSSVSGVNEARLILALVLVRGMSVMTVDTATNATTVGHPVKSFIRLTRKLY